MSHVKMREICLAAIKANPELADTAIDLLVESLDRERFAPKPEPRQQTLFETALESVEAAANHQLKAKLRDIFSYYSQQKPLKWLKKGNAASVYNLLTSWTELNKIPRNDIQRAIDELRSEGFVEVVAGSRGGLYYKLKK